MGLCASAGSEPIAPAGGTVGSPTSIAPSGGLKNQPSAGPARQASTEAKMEARARLGARKRGVKVSRDNEPVDFASIPDVPKSDDEVAFIGEALKKQWLFQGMEEDALGLVISKMSARDFNADDNIVSQGEEGLEFFVLAEGQCGVKVDGKTLPHTIDRGGGFGELALFYEEPRSATVYAKGGPVKTWVLDKKTFRGGLASREEQMISSNAKFLMEVPFFKEFEGDPALQSYLQKVSEVMVPAEFKAGDTIIRQGDMGHTFYIVTEGTCAVEEDGERKDHKIVAGNWFGEKALVGESSTRTATILAESDTVKCIGMDRKAFKELMMPFEVFRNTEGTKEQGTLGQHTGKIPHIELGDYEHRRVLGVGGFGLVTLVARRSDGALFANKKMQKSLVVQEQMQKFVKQEKLFMAELSGNPFVPILEGTARDKDSVYLMLEFLAGGDLFSVIEQHGCLNEKPMVQFAAACTIMALQHVHKHSIAFRDLKLENLVLDARGYIKMVDFGLAKRILHRSYTFCGSPRYCAPEMVTGKGHSRAVDWWALGVVIFESLFAMSPFDDNCDDVELFRRIANAPLVFPDYPPVSNQAQKFIGALLHKDHNHRLGNLANGSDGCIQHQWFNDFDWAGLKNQTLGAPYVPPAYNQAQDQAASENVDVPEMHSTLTPYNPSADDQAGWDEVF